MGLKKTIKKIPLVRPLGHFVKERLIDFRAIRCLLAERRVKHSSGPIRVGFFCQYIPAWTKIEDLYKAMRSDPRFEPILLCIPSGIVNQQLEDPSSLENDAYRYCLEHNYPEAVNTLVAKNTWLDLKSLDLHYIFYPRPYNMLLPACYSTHAVGRHSRVCMLMYGLEFAEEMTKTSLNRDFLATTYYYFAELPFMRRLNRNRNRLGHWLKLQKTECHGYPMFAHLQEYQNVSSPSWEFSKNDFRVLWTPRWTTDLASGGSNFFTYYATLLRFAEENSGMDFLFRPHPLALSHFVETGEMTEEQAASFKEHCAALPNVSLDTAPNYEATLWQTSVMISDISSIMPEYFITGKPLIFCASNMILKLSDYMMRMLEGCYVVNNEQELFDCLRMLSRGEDPLGAIRQEIIQEQFGSSFSGACENIMTALAQDHKAP